MSFEVKPPIYLYNVDKEFPIMGKPPEANLTAQVREFLAQPVFLYPMFVPQGGSSLEVSFSSLVDPHSFLSCVSFTLIFPIPFLTPSAPIYRLPLMGLSWWWGRFVYVGGAPLGYIPDQMGPTSQDKCDCLEICTCCQLVLGRRFP